MSHTILLVQPVANKASRTYSDFETVPQAMDGVLALFEKRLKELNPQMRQITYDINDLYRYIDTLQNLSALVFASARVSSGCDVMNPCNRGAYTPHGKDWIKQQCFTHLKKQAGGR